MVNYDHNHHRRLTICPARYTDKTGAGRSGAVVGKSGRIRRRHRPLNSKQAKQLSRREREVGLRPEDRRDRTVDLP